MQRNNIPFRPVRTLESKLGSDIAINDGYLYFTTDTQKIFLGLPNGEKISMGGNTGIFYGQKTIEYPDDGNKPNPEVIFTLSQLSEESDIEGNRLPLIDDLILNTDGCFYRVVDIIDENSVLTNRITLQGTGSGGGGDSPSGGGSFTIARDGSQTKYYSSGDMEMLIGIIAHSNDTENYISMVEVSFNKDFSEPFKIDEGLMWPLERLYTIDLIKQKDQFSGVAKRVYVRITDKYGVQRSTYYDIIIAVLQIQTVEPVIIQAKDNIFTFSCNIEGNAGIVDRVIEYRFYDKTGNEITNYYQYSNVEINETNIVKTIDVSNMQHGDYEMRVALRGRVGGANTIYSNVLTRKIVKYDLAINTPVFTYLLPDKREQYTDIVIQYMLSYGNEVKSYDLSIYANEELLTTQSVSTGRIENYTLSFDKAETYKINFIIENLGVNEELSLTITEYTGILPVINIGRDDLKVYLTAKGRTNNNINKEVWPDYKNSMMQGYLDKMYYGNINGWLKDENGVDYLKLSQGATATFNAFDFYGNKNPKITGMTFELDFKISGVLDYSKSLIECISRANDETISSGFQIFGDEFKIYASGAWKNAEGQVSSSNSLNLVEDKRIRLSYVVESNQYEEFPMCYIYLNGILSYANTYDKENAIFSNTATKAFLNIDSTFAELSIYNIRFYQSALNAQTVLNNYQASLSTLEQRQISYDSNAIRDINGKIDLNKIENGTYNLMIPYAKIIGGYKTGKDFTMAAAAANNVQALPTGANAKKDYRAIDIEVHYPTKLQNPYFEGYEDFVLKTTFDDPTLNVLNGFGKMPNTGAMMYAQGTSSLEYPVKNLRVKTKGLKIKVRPDLEPVNLICFKADYMESSGSHNTGASNFIDAAYELKQMKTPGQAYYSDEKIVTCIKGHPCVIFWSKTGESGTFEYIGKYNLNLDKATPEPFGFKNDEENPDSTFGYLTNEQGQYVDYDGNIVSKENRVNSIFCFEFLDNAVQVCNFLPYQEKNENEEVIKTWTYEDSWYKHMINKDGDEVPGWAIGFESRYPEDKLGDNDADALYDMARWVNELAQLYGIPALKGESAEVPATRELALTRFKNEYTRYFNKDFLLAYYVITNTLLMADSRVKNMMIATWGKENCTWTNLQGELVQDYNWIWYPIFYDMDTMLGLDNTGAPNKFYYEEDTKQSLFNGDEVLWVFVREALEREVANFHSEMESDANLTAAGILPYFNLNQANMANETFYNEDAIYKYISPFRTGYQDDLNNEWVAAGTSDKLYAAQGDRSLMREYFVTNRTRYLRGKYATAGYQGGDRIEFRMQVPSDPFIYSYYQYNDLIWNALTEYNYKDANYIFTVLLNGDSDEILLNSVVNPANNDVVCILRCKTNEQEDLLIGKSNIAVQGEGNFELTSLGRGYIGVKIGQNGVPSVAAFGEKETKTIFVDASSANGTEAYILGLSNITDLGDLSNKYLQNFVIKTGDVRLEKLILGNHHRDYYNPNWKNMTNIGLGGCKYLKEFNLENCSTFGGKIDFSSCSAIQNINVIGSSITSVTLPKSSVLRELRLPISIETLSIDSQPYLVNNNFTLGEFVYTNEIDGYYRNDYSKLLRANIRNTPIDTFTLAKESLKNNLFEYCLQDINWTISNSEDFILSENGKELLGLKILSDIPKVGLRSISIYSEDDNLTEKTALTGTIIVEANNLIVNEYALYNQYQSIFPNVIIIYHSTNLKPASSIQFYNTEEIIGQPYYSVLTDGTASLEQLTGKDGPLKEPLSNPNKQSTNEKDFTFSGVWYVAESNDSQIPEGTKINASDFNNYMPKGNLKLTATFVSSDRYYEVTLYDYDETILVSDLLTWNEDIGEALLQYTASYYNYREYDGSKEHYRYAFKGWQSEYDFKNNPMTLTYDTLDGKHVQGKIKLYAYYVEENCQTTSSDSKYFTLSQDNKVLQIAEKYRTKLKGKITLPSIVNGFTPLTVGGANVFCADCENITDIYFLSDANYTEIGNSALEGCRNLEKFHNMPETIRSFDTRAFANCSKLQMNKLPLNLEYIGIGCFAQCAKVNITEFGTISNAPKLNTIKNLAFSNAGKNISGDIYIGKTLQLGEPLLTIEDQAFSGYGSNINTLYIYDSASQNDYNKFGIVAQNIVIMGGEG